MHQFINTFSDLVWHLDINMAALIVDKADEWRCFKFKPVKNFFGLKRDKSCSSLSP